MTGTIAALTVLSGCSAIHEQLDHLNSAVDAFHQKDLEAGFNRASDKAVAGGWFPQEKVGPARASLDWIDDDTIEYLIEDENETYDPEKLSAPLVAHYLAEAKARGDKVKAYRSNLHAQALSALSLYKSSEHVVSMGTWRYVPAGSLYIEYAPSGEMRSALLRQNFGEFSDPSRVHYSKSYVHVIYGFKVRSLENRFSNSALKDSEIGGAAN